MQLKKETKPNPSKLIIFIQIHLTELLYSNRYNHPESGKVPEGVLDCDVVISEFELRSCSYVDFPTNIL